jgi:hypothetical protein
MRHIFMSASCLSTLFYSLLEGQVQREFQGCSVGASLQVFSISEGSGDLQPALQLTLLGDSQQQAL